MKLTKIIGTLAFSALMVPVFTACKDDDGPSKGSNVNDADKGILNIDGARLTAINQFRYQYDNKGRLIEVSDSYDDVIDIDYDDASIELWEDDGTIAFNSNGLVTQVSLSWDEKSSDYSDKGSVVMNFKYNNGYLASIDGSYSGTEIYYDENVTNNYKSTINYNLTWTEGNLVTFAGSGVETDVEGKYNWEESYKFSYGQDDNKFYQFPIRMAFDVLGETDLDLLAPVGLFGKGPAKLPTSCTESYQDDDDDEPYVNTDYFEFELNNNGSIDEEIVNGYAYSYSYQNSASKSTPDFGVRAKKTSSFKKYFLRHRYNKNK